MLIQPDSCSEPAELKADRGALRVHQTTDDTGSDHRIYDGVLRTHHVSDRRSGNGGHGQNFLGISLPPRADLPPLYSARSSKLSFALGTQYEGCPSGQPFAFMSLDRVTRAHGRV